ncbi:MAG: AMP-binding protein [Desulfamplus sp.]|nr:AMP-binding protein [Desulfamplus sp.]
MRREITTKEAGTLSGLFKLRVKYSPDKMAFKYFDKTDNKYIDKTWQETAKGVAQWHAALKRENLSKGDRVGVMIGVSYERILFEFAAFGLGLVIVPMPTNSFEIADNIANIFKETQIKFVLIEDETQEGLLFSVGNIVHNLKIVTLNQISSWLPEEYNIELPDIAFNTDPSDPDELATIHYSSGTSGMSKGAMLSHKNILYNAEAISNYTNIDDNDLLVPFTGGYIFPVMMDFATAFPSSTHPIEDLRIIRPTHIVSANRLYEYLYKQISMKLSKQPIWMQLLFKQAVETGWERFEYLQGRAKWQPKFLFWFLFDALIAKSIRQIFGGRLRCGFYAGGIIAPEIYKTFIGLGLPLLNCYGQAEAGPVISMSSPEDNLPSSVGKPLKGLDFQIKKENGELLVKSPSVMMGYWNNPSATEKTLNDGWLHTGDMFQIDNKDHLFFMGRMSDLIVLQNGEKISPVHIEAAIKTDLLFDQVMVIGKEKPFLTALVVLNKELFKKLIQNIKLKKRVALDPDAPLTLKNSYVKDAVLDRISDTMRDYSDYPKIRRVTLLVEVWTVEAGLLTVSLKLKRKALYEKYEKEIKQMYL